MKLSSPSRPACKLPPVRHLRSAAPALRARGTPDLPSACCILAEADPSYLVLSTLPGFLLDPLCGAAFSARSQTVSSEGGANAPSELAQRGKSAPQVDVGASGASRSETTWGSMARMSCPDSAIRGPCPYAVPLRPASVSSPPPARGLHGINQQSDAISNQPSRTVIVLNKRVLQVALRIVVRSNVAPRIAVRLIVVGPGAIRPLPRGAGRSDGGLEEASKVVRSKAAEPPCHRGITAPLESGSARAPVLPPNCSPLHVPLPVYQRC